MEQGRKILDEVLAANPDVMLSAKVASNHSKILRNDPRPSRRQSANWMRCVMDERQDLRRRADGGDQDAVGQLAELAGEAGDLEELRRLADAGSSDATDILVELAGEREDFDELRRLAELGNSDAADVLAELQG